MYESFYGLKDRPFSMLPDPGFLYLSKKHQTALTLLEYALYNNAGLCVISGDIGAGKTTLLRKLLESMEANIKVGMITNTHQSFGKLLDWVLSAYGIHKPGLNNVEMHQVFIDFLMQQYAQQKTTLLIVDEAQNMSIEALEELRMLSNINSEKDQLLQVILAGQPELKDTLRRPELKQFVQRIAVDYHLGALDLEETHAYISHRLAVAGAQQQVFTPLACQRIHEYSGGVPRLINLLCDTAMVYGFADQLELIADDLVDEMVNERMADSLVPINRSARQPPAASTQLLQASAKANKPVKAPAAEKKKANKAPIALSPEAQTAPVQIKPVVAAPEVVAAPQPATEPVALSAAKSAVTYPLDENLDEDMDEDEEAAYRGYGQDKPAILKQQRQNRIRSAPAAAVKPPPLFGRWSIALLLVLATAVLYLVVREQGDELVPAQVAAPPATTVPAAGAIVEPVAASTPESAAALVPERVEDRLSREQARLEQIEAEARVLQQQQDEALARAQQEEREQQQLAEEASKAARNARERKALAAKQKAEKEARARKQAAARQLELEQEAKRNSEQEALRQRVLELEREIKNQAETVAIPATTPAATPTVQAAAQTEPSPQGAAVKTTQANSEADPDLEFIPDPCQGPSAKFLSTCRR